MLRALKAHHDTFKPGGLLPHQIFFGSEPLGRGRPLSSEGMAMDAKEFFARQETTARESRRQLEKEHAMRAKIALKSSTGVQREGPGVDIETPAHAHPTQQDRRAGVQGW